MKSLLAITVLMMSTVSLAGQLDGTWQLSSFRCSAADEQYPADVQAELDGLIKGNEATLTINKNVAVTKIATACGTEVFTHKVQNQSLKFKKFELVQEDESCAQYRVEPSHDKQIVNVTPSRIEMTGDDTDSIFCESGTVFIYERQ